MRESWGGVGILAGNTGAMDQAAPRLWPAFSTKEESLSLSPKHARGISSVCPHVAGGGAPCPANLQMKSMGGSIARVRFHPWRLRNRSANATAPSEEETMEDKTRLRIVSCLARPGWLHKPASGQSHVQGTREGLG